MSHRFIDSPMRAHGRLFLPVLVLTCLLSCALVTGAQAYTQTIEDIEDPAVKAKVVGLEVEASDQGYVEATYPGAPMVLSTLTWDHALEGRVDGSLSPAQMPEVTVTRNPLSVTIEGELATDKAEGQVLYQDIEYCDGGRLTTKSDRLDVSLSGFYQRGSASSVNPAAALTTQNLDPWKGGCPSGTVQPQPTRVETFSSPTRSTFEYASIGGASELQQDWTPREGSVTTVKDGCTAEHCDFTITGENKNTSQYGSANSSFTLKLRLEYPAVPPGPAPDTKITKKPRKVIKTRSGKARIAFRFETTGPEGTRFQCRLDKGGFRSCSSPFKRQIGKGRHRFAVRSVFEGKVDPSPAVYVWTVKKLKKKSRR